MMPANACKQKNCNSKTRAIAAKAGVVEEAGIPV